jgi:outer membrane protein TolC
MKKFGFLTIFLIFLNFTFAFFSQEKVVLPIDEAVKKALSANPRLIAAKLESVAATKRKEETFANHFGELSFVANYNHFERDRILVPIAEELFKNPALGMMQLPWDKNQTHYGLSFTLPLLANGSLHEGDKIAKLLEDSAFKMSIFTKEETIYNVKSAYRNVLILKHALDSAQSYRDALQKDFEDAKLKLQLGQIATVDLQKIEFSYENAKAQYEDIKAQYLYAFSVLSALMGEEPDENKYELLDDESKIDEPQEEEETNNAFLLRKDYLAQVNSTKVAEHKKHLALSAFAPQLVLQANYLKNTAPSVEEDLYTREWFIALKIPIFNGLKRVRAVQESAINLEIEKEKERGKKLEIETQIVNAKARIKSAMELYNSGKVQRDLGKEVSRIEKLKLEQGNGKIEDYLLAKYQEFQGEASYWRGLYTYKNSIDYYKFVIGKGDESE